nr:MAG: Connector [Bacteriophage sp.]
MFEWKGLPESVDSRYMELHLFSNGCMVYFNDEVMGNLCLDCTYNGGLDVYGYPILRRAYSSYNGYNRLLKDSNSVIIWNNLLHIPSEADIRAYAKRLWMLDRIIDVNANAQKTPILVQGNEKQRLSLVNLYKEYDGNAPVIFGDTSLNTEGLKSISTGAPYVADRIYELKTQIWNEALTYLGISNINIQKKERLITDEVTRNQGGTVASRYSRLEARQQAVERINAMFGTSIKVSYREDYQEIEAENVINNIGNGGDGDE